MKAGIAVVSLTALCLIGLAIMPLGGVLIWKRHEIKRNVNDWLKDPKWQWPPAAAM
jgi:hypothetical protein